MDLTNEQIVNILHLMWTNGYQSEGIMGFWLWATPLRHSDILQLEREDFDVTAQSTKKFIRIDVRKTKTIRRKVDGGLWTLPVGWLPWAPEELLTAALHHVREGDPKAKLFTCDLASFNEVMKAAFPIGEYGEYPTSYSLRRSFLQRICRRFEHQVTGAVDYDKAAKLTLHKSGKILKAVYERRVYEGEIGEHDDVEDSDAE
jgi:integrase